MTQDLINSSRLKARTILQESMPASILRLQALVSQETDPSSPFWIGHLEKGAYVADNLRLYQPGQAVPDCIKPIGPGDIKGNLTQVGIEGVEGVEKIVEEDMQDRMISRGTGDGVIEQDDITKIAAASVGGTGMDTKQKVGVHWFEFFPRNAIQEECIKLVRV